MKWNNEEYQWTPIVLLFIQHLTEKSSTAQKPHQTNGTIFCPVNVLFCILGIFLSGWLVNNQMSFFFHHSAPPYISYISRLVKSYQRDLPVFLNTSIPLSLKWPALSLIVCYRCRTHNRIGWISLHDYLPGGNGRSVSPGHGAKTIILITAGQLAAGHKKPFWKVKWVCLSVCECLPPPRLSHTTHFCISH